MIGYRKVCRRKKRRLQNHMILFLTTFQKLHSRTFHRQLFRNHLLLFVFPSSVHFVSVGVRDPNLGFLKAWVVKYYGKTNSFWRASWNICGIKAWLWLGRIINFSIRLPRITTNTALFTDHATYFVYYTSIFKKNILPFRFLFVADLKLACVFVLSWIVKIWLIFMSKILIFYYHRFSIYLPICLNKLRPMSV